MTRLWIDTEAFSPADLKQVGGYCYAMHPETVVTLVPYALDDGPVQLWEPELQPMPDDLAAALARESVDIWAHNAQFDRVLLKYAGIDTSIERWHCTMVQALTLGLPAGLDALGRYLEVPLPKLADGRRLIHKFCLPNRHGERTLPDHWPEDWELFKAYAVRDVEAMRECARRMPDWNYPAGVERELYHLDQAINDAGLPMDPELAERAVEVVEKALAEMHRRMHELTDGAVPDANKVTALKHWLMDLGVEVPSLAKAEIAELLEGDKLLPEKARQALALRRDAAKTSNAKYAAVRRALGPDNRLRGTLQFYGASRTGRWSGRIFQPQNLPRGQVDGPTAVRALLGGLAADLYDNPLVAASAAIRGTVKATKGHKLVVSDLSAIEGRVLAWLAGEAWKLDAYAAGEDLYVLAYAKTFRLAPEQVDKAGRQVGKVEELALGYQGGVGAFQTMAAGYGLTLPSEDAVIEIIRGWRAANPAIVSWWWELNDTVRLAADHPGKSLQARTVRIAVRRHDGRFWLLIRLPSGRFLAYPRPLTEWVTRTFVNPETGEAETKEMLNLRFDAFEKGRPGRDYTYGGKIAENITQAVARDVLAHALLRVHDAGYRIVGHVHDEVICEVPDSDEFTADELSRLLSVVPEWAPGLPLAAKGFETDRYRKD